MRSTGSEVVGVDRDEGKQALAGCLAAWVHELAEGCASGERTGARCVHLTGTMIGVAEDDVALRDAEPVADRVEGLPRVDEKIASTAEASDRGLDHREQDEALRAAEHVADRIATLARLVEDLTRAGVLAEEVVDLSQHD